MRQTEGETYIDKKTENLVSKQQYESRSSNVGFGAQIMTSSSGNKKKEVV